MSRLDRIALLLSLIAALVAYYVTITYSEGIPHIEDEIAYVWQAEAIAGGKLTVPSPPSPESFLVPFVVDHNGQRFGKYPLGWPVVLAIGIHFGIRSLINPLLAGLGVWLTYRLGKKVLSETVGIIAAGLTLVSPFFLMNSASLLSHPFGLVLSTAFVLTWMDGFGELSSPRNWLPTITIGLTLGVLVLTRPLTAVAVVFPFIFHGLYLIWRGDSETRYHVLAVGGLAVGVGSLIFLWQYAVTGDALINPYTLWWPYDKLGFGSGVGSTQSGHSLRLAYINTRFSLWVGYRDLYGWGPVSWIFLPFGLLVVILRRNWKAILVGAVFPSLVLFYMAYWVGAWLLGPRYYYEGLFSLTLISAVGIAWLAGWPIHPDESWQTYRGWKRFRPLFIVAVLIVLISGNLVYYTPMRLDTMKGLYGMERADLKPFQNDQIDELTPALVVVHPKNWMEYGVLLDLQDPFLNSPYIFVLSQGDQADRDLVNEFPGRKIYHYYPQEPYVFFTAPIR